MMNHFEFEKDRLANGEVATLNPLRIAMNRERSVTVSAISLSGQREILNTNVKQSKARAFLESNKQKVSKLLMLLYLLLFVVFPMASLLFFKSHLKFKGLLALICTGIIQPWSIYMIVSFETRTYLSKTNLGTGYKVWLMFAILFTSLFFPDTVEWKNGVQPQSKGFKRPAFGQCKLLEDLPDAMVAQFRTAQKQRRHMFYYPDLKYPLAMKYDQATLHALINGMNFIYSITEDELTIGGSKSCQMTDELFSLFFLQRVFKPCTEYCTPPDYVCHESCSAILKCFFNEKEINSTNEIIRGSSMFSNLKIEDLETKYSAIFSTLLKPAFDKHADSKDKAESSRWVKEVARYFLEEVQGFMAGGTSNVCKSRERLNASRNESCYNMDARTYGSPPTGWVLRDSNKICSVAQLYKFEKKTAHLGGIVNDSTRGHVFLVHLLLLVPCLPFYVFVLFTLKAWNRGNKEEEENSTNASKEQSRFNLGWKGRCGMAGLSLLAFACSAALFGFIMTNFAAEYENYQNYDKLSLGIVYLILSIAIVFSLVVGLQLATVAISGHGAIVYDNISEEGKKNCFQRILDQYKQSTSLRNGEFFFAEMMVWEIFEIAMLIISLQTFYGQKPQLYVQMASVFFFLNLLVNTLFVFLQIKVPPDASESGLRNGMFLATDTIIDFMCFCLNMSFLKSTDLYGDPFVGSMSLAQPSILFLLRLQEMGEAIGVKLVEKSKPEEGLTKPRTKTRAQGLKGLFIIMLCGVVFATVQLFYVVGSSVHINSKCSAELGSVLWENAEPKLVFKNGIFGVPECSYETIKEIIAPGLKIKALSPYIENCTRLTKLDLRDNEIIHLPRELLLMDEIKTVLLSGNKASRELSATHMSLTGGVPRFVLQHLSQTLVSLDLSNNDIAYVSSSLASFVRLRRIDFSYNNISSDGLAWEIVDMVEQLETFKLGNNPCSYAVNWANQKGFQRKAKNSIQALTNAILFLEKYLTDTLQGLNVSSTRLDVPHHFDSIIAKFPSLKWLDVSNNVEMKASHSNPLNISLKYQMKRLFFLNLEGCAGIEAVVFSDLQEMEKRFTEQSGKYNLRGTGMRQLSFINVEEGYFPKHIVSQIHTNVLAVSMKDCTWVNFDFDALCNLTNVESVLLRQSLRNAANGFIRPKEYCVPGCWKQLTKLSLVSFNRVRLDMSCLYKHQLSVLSRIKKVIVHHGWESMYSYESGPFLEFGNQSKVETLSIEGFRPTRNLPGSYRTIDNIYIVIVNDTNISITVPKNWNDFHNLYLNGPIGGSVGRIGIKESMYVAASTVTGPLGSIEPEIYCITVPRSSSSEEENVFENKWAKPMANCTSVDKSNFSLSLHDIDDAQFIQPVLKNCSFSTKVNMICFEKDAGYENGKTGIIYNGWECYNQHHLIFSGGAMTCFNYARFVSS